MFTALSLLWGCSGGGGGPTVDPANPSYLRFQNKTVTLISNTEHYGSLINLDFDYKAYFAALAEDGFTMTQTFAGSYVEPVSDCGANNTLSPKNGSYIAPWQRSTVPGNSKGGTLWDLTKHNASYFARLEDYVKTAEQHGIVVDLTLFCGYELAHDFIWDGCPFNPKNTVNKALLAGVARDNVYSTRTPPAMLKIQRDMVAKIATVLKPFTNVIYQLVFTQAGGATAAWGEMMIQVLKDADPTRLVSAPATWKLPGTTFPSYNFGAAFATTAPHRNLSAVCGATPVGGGRAGAVTAGAGAGAGVGAVAQTWRASYWCWLLEGAASVLNLDWSYAVGHEAGTLADEQTKKTPSGPHYRGALKVLGAVAARLDLEHMEPMPSGTWSVRSAVLPAPTPTHSTHAHAAQTTVHSMGPRYQQGNQFVVFAAGANMTSVEALLGSYVPATIDVWECELEWLAPQSGKVLGSRRIELLRSFAAVTKLAVPPTYTEDIAALIICDQARQ